ncbi:Nucleoside-diphosphate-sugar epimerase [Mesorhizobium australicum]|uniref:Nucleoside-diphosphate-sugar epimerase n=2 Tax=Mesorhizobium australicum TaxID=536018 RepID=A0A1X7N8B3_9HYPH|nr:SDR family oxidoreductase [Mesorhizobium australicum]SMH33064.1 Nucleoside-diphosphate-sugar epimerase [Mesorhizobium australicum]
MTMRIFLFGAGYSARAFAKLAADEADAIAGTTRSESKADALRTAGIQPFLFDGTDVSPQIAAELAQATHLVISAAPTEAGDPVIAAAHHLLTGAMPALRWIGYLSTVGVYGNHDGAWIDETAECRPRPGRSDNRLEAEKEWSDLARQRGVPLAILRLSGIYGPGRNALVNLENGTARRIIKPGQIFNRIHVDDIAGSLLHLARHETGGVFNVTDDEPSPPQDVVAFAARLMGVAPPPEVDFDTADLTPMARSFYGENKRVSNAKLKSTDYRFIHPDYRAALTAMWAKGNWRR